MFPVMSRKTSGRVGVLLHPPSCLHCQQPSTSFRILGKQFFILKVTFFFYIQDVPTMPLMFQSKYCLQRMLITKRGMR